MFFKLKFSQIKLGCFASVFKQQIVYYDDLLIYDIVQEIILRNQKFSLFIVNIVLDSFSIKVYLDFRIWRINLWFLLHP